MTAAAALAARAGPGAERDIKTAISGRTSAQKSPSSALRRLMRGCLPRSGSSWCNDLLTPAWARLTMGTIMTTAATSALVVPDHPVTKRSFASRDAIRCLHVASHRSNCRVRSTPHRSMLITALTRQLLFVEPPALADLVRVATSEQQRQNYTLSVLPCFTTATAFLKSTQIKSCGMPEQYKWRKIN